MTDTHTFRDMFRDDDEPAEPAGHRVTALEGRRLTVREQAQAAAEDAGRTAWRRFRAACKRDGGFVHGLMSEKPPSVAEQVAYAESKAWVTTGHEDGVFDVAGSAYQRFTGISGVAYHDAMAALYARPLRFGIFLGVFTALSVILASWLGLTAYVIIAAFLRLIVFPVAVTVLRPRGGGR